MFWEYCNLSMIKTEVSFTLPQGDEVWGAVWWRDKRTGLKVILSVNSVYFSTTIYRVPSVCQDQC